MTDYERGYLQGKSDAQKPWVGLTDEELAELIWNLWRSIEEKLKEKNT